MTTLAVRNPRNGEYDYQMPVTDAAAVQRLAASLRAAQPAWREAGIAARIDALRAFRQALLDHEQAVVAALSVDTGRHLLARGEVQGVAGSIARWCALAPGLLATRSTRASTLGTVRIDAELDPYPLLGAISPWNFPLLLSFIDVVPALLAGSAAIIKPSEVTPRFAEVVAGLIAGIPELQAVLRFATGDGATGAALVPAVDVVAFTGSVATGRKVARAAAEAFIPAFLELGGKDPAVVLAGADVGRAATAILRASVAATGQACQSLERIYVHASLADALVDALTAQAAAVTLSYPDPHQGIVGPLIFERQADVLRAHLDDARARGAIVHTGGEVRVEGGGCWIAPTVLSRVDHSMLVMTEESFGPLMPVMAFDDVDQAVALANDSVYGLSAAVFGPDDASAIAVARRINAGGISINDAGLTTMVFDAQKSAYCQSGLGPSRMGASGLTRFLRHKALYVNEGDVLPIGIMSESTAVQQET